MIDTEYFEERLNEQLAWYSKNSRKNKKWYMWLKLIEICAAAFIPLLSGLNMNSTALQDQTWIIGILGVLIAIIVATSSVLKFHEKWIQYRTTAEQLKHEKFLYLTNVKPYDTDDKFSLLVECVEALLSRENSKWTQSIAQITKKGNNKETQ